MDNPQPAQPAPGPLLTPTAAAVQALAEVCSSPLPFQSFGPVLQDLDLKRPEDLTHLAGLIATLRTEAACHVVRAVRQAEARQPSPADAQAARVAADVEQFAKNWAGVSEGSLTAPNGISRGTPDENTYSRDKPPGPGSSGGPWWVGKSGTPERRIRPGEDAVLTPRMTRDPESYSAEWNQPPHDTKPAVGWMEPPHPAWPHCHVVIVGDAAEVEDARRIYPQRTIIVAGGPYACKWLSALLTVRLETPALLTWLLHARMVCCDGKGAEVATFAASAPRWGQDASTVVIVWDPADLDAVTASAGSGQWVTLWGGPIRQMLTGLVVVVGQPTLALHYQWMRASVMPWLAQGNVVQVQATLPTLRL